MVGRPRVTAGRTGRGSRWARVLPLGLLAPAAVFVWPEASLATPVGPEFQISTGAYTQYVPAVAMDADGDFVATWFSIDQDGNGYGVYAQRFDATGTAQGPEFRVNTTTAGDQTAPDVAMDADGDFIVVWHNYDDVMAQRYDAAGVPQGGELRVNTFTQLNQTNPAVAMDAAGNAVVVWSSVFQDGSHYGVYGQRLDVSGAMVGPEFRANEVTAGSQLTPDVDAGPGGNFVVTWTGTDPAAVERDVYARPFSATGDTSGPDIRVNEAVPGTHVDASAVGIAADGSFVVAWHRYVPGAFDADVFARRFSGAGVALGGEIRANGDPAGYQTAADVAVDDEGEFLVTWQDTNGLRIGTQRFGADGSRRGPEFSSGTFVPGQAPQAAAAAVDTDGDAVVAWHQGGDGVGTGIFGQRHDRGFPEVCDGADNDLDGDVDEAVTSTYFEDDDNDGYGSTVSTEACAAPAGHVANSGDADDTDGSVHPGAPELDDGKDNDQDGTTDEGLDGDSDGYTPAFGGDCDDADATVHPGAAEADNGVDDDCDQSTDEGLDGDGDGYTPIADGDADDDDDAVHPGAPELCDGKDNNQDGTTDEGCTRDADGDGLLDIRDPDVVLVAIDALAPASLRTGGTLAAFLDRLDKAEALIVAGRTGDAVKELKSLRKRVDGCNGTSRERADADDWIVDCSDQRTIRSLIDGLITNL
jgi:hypothetical protein